MCGFKYFVYFAITNLAVIELGRSEEQLTNNKLSVSNSGQKTLIIDTDAGSDDAMAILNLLGEEELLKNVKVQSITTVHGNTHVDNVVRNVLKTLKTANRLNIPVYKGANQSLLITPVTENFFGEDGFGDFYFPDPPSIDLAQTQHAVNALIEQANLQPGVLSLVCLGPLTNIALAIRLDDKFLRKLKEIYILGGSDSGVGNIKPGVEYNFYMDPEAASIVLKEADKANKILHILPWETALDRSIIKMEWRKNVLGILKSPHIDFLNKAENPVLTGTNWISSDTLLSSVVIDTKIVEFSDDYHGEVEISGTLSRGSLYIDYINSTNQTKNIRIIKKLNTDMVKRMLLRNLDTWGSEKNGASRK